MIVLEDYLIRECSFLNKLRSLCGSIKKILKRGYFQVSLNFGDVKGYRGSNFRITDEYNFSVLRYAHNNERPEPFTNPVLYLFVRNTST